MNINIGKIICTVGATCRFFPVEILTCIFFFISQELHIGRAGAEPLMFLPYAFAIVFSINQIAAVSRFRAAYYASFLATIPLAVTDLMRFLSTPGYLACLLLAIFVVILSGCRRGNREIARYFSSMVINIAFSLLLKFVVCGRCNYLQHHLVHIQHMGRLGSTHSGIHILGYMAGNILYVPFQD